MGRDCVAAPRQIRVCGKVSMAASPAGAIGGGPAIEQRLECTRGRYAQQGTSAARMDMGGDYIAAPRPNSESGTGAMEASPAGAIGGGPASLQNFNLECTRGRYAQQGTSAARMDMEGDYVAAPRPIRERSKYAMAVSPAGAIGGGHASLQNLECPGGRYAPQGACRARMDMGGDCVADPRPNRENGIRSMAVSPAGAIGGGPAIEQKLECTRRRYSPQWA